MFGELLRQLPGQPMETIGLESLFYSLSVVVELVLRPVVTPCQSLSSVRSKDNLLNTI